MKIISTLLAIFIFCNSPLIAKVFAGAGICEITPPFGTPSAGYAARQGEGMEGVHDPLLATALIVDNGDQKIAFCSVDHLGFDHTMVQEVPCLDLKLPHPFRWRRLFANAFDSRDVGRSIRFSYPQSLHPRGSSGNH